MNIKQSLAPFAAYLLRNIKTHKNRKRFAKFVGNYFDNTKAKTAYGFMMFAKWYDNENRTCFEGSHGIVADFISDLPSDSIFIDIGANQGCTSILASKVFSNNQNNGVVISFEPSIFSFGLMERNIKLNKCNNIFAFNRAVSSKKLKLYLNENDKENSGASHISEKGNPIIAGPIKVEDLRKITKNNDIFIKIDTEGYEMFVIEGLEELFKEKLVHKLLVEIDELNLIKYGSSSIELYNCLEKYGFKPIIGLKKGHYDEVFIQKK